MFSVLQRFISAAVKSDLDFRSESILIFRDIFMALIILMKFFVIMRLQRYCLTQTLNVYSSSFFFLDFPESASFHLK